MDIAVSHRAANRLVPVIAHGLVAALLTLVAADANATEGYMQNGIGARGKALAGAGVANSTDATAAALNPAGLANVGSQSASSVSFFNLRGGFSSVGSGGFTADGAHTSDRDWATIPNMAINWRINRPLVDAIALSVYGNGGVMTHYGDMASTTCATYAGSGAFCRGPMGVAMNQTFFSLAFAKQVAPGFSLGIAPILARTTMKVDGLSIFSSASSDAAHFTNRGADDAWGTGVRAGMEWKVAPGLKLGVAGNSRIYMQPLEEYRGLFAQQGRIDAPATIQAGIAYDIRPNITMMLDYKHIWNGSVAALGNTSTTTGTVLFGTDGGPGFGLRDLDIFKVAMEWRANRLLTLRAGYSYNTAPFKSKDADLTVMHLGVVQHHITGGAKLAVSEKMDLELSAMYAPRTTLTGPELMNPTPGRIMTTEAEQFEITLGAIYRFGDAPRATAPLK